MTGYVRKDTTNNIADGNVINAADLDAEFDGVKDAFQASTGHKHDGTTGEGAPITSLGPNQDVTISATLLAPKTTNTVDIGSSALKFKDLFLAGNGSVGGTLAVTGVATLTANPVLSAGTANGVAYLNGSKVVTSGSALTFDGSKLTVSSSGEQLKLTSSGSFASTGEGYIRWYDSVGAKGYIGYAGTANQFDLQTGSGMNFNLNATGGTATFAVSNAEQMRLNSTGLGIGTSSPAYKLEVNGQIGCSDNFVFTTANPAIVVNSGYLRVFTGGSERMRLDSSGNLGLGVTDPATYGGVFVARATSGANFSVRTLAGIGGSGTGVGLDTLNDGASSVADLGIRANTIQFRNSGSEAARIDSSGNLLVGTTSANGKLAVAGSLWYSGDLLCVTGGETARFGYEAYESTGGFNLYTQGGKPLVFGTSSVERARIDSSGNLGLGTTAPNYKLDMHGGAGVGLQIYETSTGDNKRLILTQTSSGATYNATYSSNSNNHIFQVGNSEAARIDSSANLLVGTTSAGDGKFRISASANAFNIIKIDDTGSTGGNYIQFLNSSGANAGTINHSGTTSVTYNSGSDYRLKNITGPVTNAAGFINSLKPKVGTWKEDGSKFVGFLAHEFAEICPQAVQGEKDAVDADGNPLYQSMEASNPEVIANIVSLLQEQQAIIESLKARLDAANL